MENIKTAGLIESILNQVKDTFDFKNRPFETIFGILGTGYSWTFGWVIGALTTLAEILGYGPGWIGKMIDEYFGFGSGKTLDDVDVNNLSASGASAHIAKKISGEISDIDLDSIIKPAMMSKLEIIKQAKGHITQEDVKSAFFATVPIVKVARWRGLRRLFSLRGSGRFTSTIAGTIRKLIKMFLKGMVALGIGGGVAAATGLKTKHNDKPSSSKDYRADLTHYKNVNHNVKETLITFLDATIANFSRGFQQAQGKMGLELDKAPGWNKVLDLIEKLNWASIHEINNFDVFVGPDIKKIAKVLLNSVNAQNVSIEKLKTPEKELSDEEKLQKLL